MAGPDATPPVRQPDGAAATKTAMQMFLCGQLDAGECALWRRHLAEVLPNDTVYTTLTGDMASSIDIALVAGGPPHGALQRLPRLRLIQSLWAGVDRLLADADLPPGVPIARMVDPAMATAMAETALWATLALHRGFFGYAAQQREARWQVQPQARAADVPVLVLGSGQMGRAVASRLGGCGYPVTAWSRQAGPDALPAALARSRIVINLLPLTPHTRGLLDARCFAAMPTGAGLVNLGRGAHVVDADLLAALDSGQIGHAVLDVFTTEPLPADHRYWTHPSVTVLPHAAALTDPRSAAQAVAANVNALREGRPLAHRVNASRGY